MESQVEEVMVPDPEQAEAPAVEGSSAAAPLVVDRALVARLVGDAQREGVAIDGEGGLLSQLTRLVVESALEGELTAHLGYEKHERVGDDGSENARNGTRAKTVLTKAGPVKIDVPRDRAGTFEPMVVKKRQRRLGSIEDIVLSLSARGLTHGDIAAHLADVYGTEVSKTTISTITDKVLDGMAEWQGRPLDAGRFLPVVANLREGDSHAPWWSEPRQSRREAAVLRADQARPVRLCRVDGGGCVAELRVVVVHRRWQRARPRNCPRQSSILQPG
jgi:hypothetical protein